jgi:hypothetical protein
MIINDNYYTINKDCFTLCIYIYIRLHILVAYLQFLGVINQQTQLGQGKRPPQGRWLKGIADQPPLGLAAGKLRGSKPTTFGDEHPEISQHIPAILL